MTIHWCVNNGCHRTESYVEVVGHSGKSTTKSLNRFDHVAQNRAIDRLNASNFWRIAAVETVQIHRATLLLVALAQPLSALVQR